MHCPVTPNSKDRSVFALLQNFLLLVALLLFLLGSNNPKQSFVGLGVVALGIPVYYLWFRGSSPRTQP
jgi:multisubunit Na+/H+ antiporter MnhB subunit